MENTLIYQTLLKNSIPFLYVEFHIQTIFSFPENEWFSPTNSDGEHYRICSHLADMYLLRVRRTPIWTEGSFRGMKVEFMYNKELQY